MSPQSPVVRRALALAIGLLAIVPAGAQAHSSRDRLDRWNIDRTQLTEIVAAQQAKAELGSSPDQNIDVGASRRLASPANRSAVVNAILAAIKARTQGKAGAPVVPPAPTPVVPAPVPAPVPSAVAGVDMRLLLVSANGDEPTFAWWKDMLTRRGVPFDTLVASTAPALTTADLQSSATRGRYQGIVLATGGLGWASPSGWASAFSQEEWTTLQAYEVAFGVREVDAYVYPEPAYGLNWPTQAGPMGGSSAALTSAGTSVFDDLRGTLPIDAGAYGYKSTPLAGASFQPLVQTSDGAPLVGTFKRADGVEQLVSTVDANQYTMHALLLGSGMLEWVTKGVHLGYGRNYLDIDVDDVFMPNSRWSTVAKVTLEEDETADIRMVPADVDRAVAWQSRTGVSLNMLYNGGSALVGDKLTPADPLTKALLARKSSFRWTSHTYDHLQMDALDQATLVTQIQDNIEFAKRNKLNADPAELVTGEHSGLTNPAMPAALAATGIKWIGADASRTPVQTAVGPALTVPRHPTGVFYNVGTQGEQLDEYNFMYAAQQGALSWDQYVNSEATIIVRHLLGNDPAPHYVHQANLAEDGTLYPVFDEVLKRYNALVKAPLVQPSQTAAGTVMRDTLAWNRALADGNVTAVKTASGVVVRSIVPVTVPLTGTSVGSPYAGDRSGWKPVGAGDTTIGL